MMNYFTPKMWRSKFEILMKLYQKLNGDEVDLKEVIQEVLKSSQSLTNIPMGDLNLDSLKLKESGETINKFVKSMSKGTNGLDLGDILNIGGVAKDFINAKGDYFEKKIREGIEIEKRREAEKRMRMKEDL